MQLEIKKLGAGDEAILDRVAEDVFDEPIRPDRLAAYLADPRHHLLVAIEAGRVVGQVAAVLYRHPDKAPELFIDEVGVTPALRQRGIARRLLDEMLALGKALGCEEAWVCTAHGNIAARRLYDSCGVPAEPFVMYTFKL
jgi:ribosomal protein S18 acetylase RimI-like enzyme